MIPIEGSLVRFIDLFSGLGGFHLGLARLGHECVFACEIDETLRAIYEKNFGLAPSSDIRAVKLKNIPEHDILCAGSPCQPFSKAGEQQGLNCPKWGDLFHQVLRIVKYHKPTYLILENVPNLARHDNGQTWRDLEAEIKRAGYKTDSAYLSPHQFGIPQIRERIFIVASRVGLGHFKWPSARKQAPLSINDVLEADPPDARSLSPQVIKCLRVWQRFVRRFPKNAELPSFPIWSMEFGATYPYEGTTPWAQRHDLARYRGSHGKKLTNLKGADLFAALPSHARPRTKSFPHWKELFITQNRKFYRLHRRWIDKWLPAILEFPPSLQKLEWNCKGGERDIWKYVIQFRASGVRIKRPTTAPSLVAMTTTQVPIIGWEHRYMTPRECARLQSMHELRYLPQVNSRVFKALGNAVNADLVAMIARALVPQEEESRKAVEIPPHSVASQSPEERDYRSRCPSNLASLPPACSSTTVSGRREITVR